MANLQLKTKRSKTAFIDIVRKDGENIQVKGTYFTYYEPIGIHLFLTKVGESYGLTEFKTGVLFREVKSKSNVVNEYLEFTGKLTPENHAFGANKLSKLPVINFDNDNLLELLRQNSALLQEKKNPYSHLYKEEQSECKAALGMVKKYLSAAKDVAGLSVEISGEKVIFKHSSGSGKIRVEENILSEIQADIIEICQKNKIMVINHLSKAKLNEVAQASNVISMTAASSYQSGTVTTACGLSLEAPAGVEMQLHSNNLGESKELNDIKHLLDISNIDKNNHYDLENALICRQEWYMDLTTQQAKEVLSAVIKEIEAYLHKLERPELYTPSREKKEPQSTFTNRENTRIYKDFAGDWIGETKLKVNGKSWVIYTAKFRNKMIGTNCRLVQDEGNGCYSFRLSSNSNNESFYLNEVRGIATEKKIKEIHFKSLADFDAKQEAGELPEAKKEYKIKVGQVIFTHGLENERKRVIYDIEAGKFGTIYKSVLLNGSETATDDHLTPFREKFGIGVYYNEGEMLEQDEITDLLISAHENMKQTEALRKVQEQVNREQREEKEKYLSQFKQADRRKTSEIVKREILKRWPEVRKVTVKTDVYSGGSSMDVRYYAPNEIEDIEAFVNSFQYGRFNGMEDIYECSGDDAPIIDGYILQTYKYCGTEWEEDNTTPACG